MPPVLLLKGDKNFYGDLKPTGFSGENTLEHPAPPPNPMSNVKLSNPIQRENAVSRITQDLSVPDNLGSSEDPTLQAELITKDTKLLKESDDLGSRFVKFLQEPLVNTTPEADINQKKREVQRIGLTDDNLAENQIRPVGEVPLRAVERGFQFLENKALNIILLIGGIYVASQFAQGFGQSVGKSKKSDN